VREDIGRHNASTRRSAMPFFKDACRCPKGFFC